MSQAAPRFDAEPPPRGWFARNWLWFVPAVIILPILLCGGCIGAIFMIGVTAIKSAEPYTQALQRLQDDPQVKEKLGEPIEEGTYLPNGNIVDQGATGSATYQFDIKGPNGSASVDFAAEKAGGVWQYSKFDVDFADGTSLDLSDEQVPGEDDAPAFDPAAENAAEEAPDAEEAAPSLDINVQ